MGDQSSAPGRQARSMCDVAPVTHILLDVDGVVNALTHTNAPEPGWDGAWRAHLHTFGRYDGAPMTGQVESYPVYYKPAMVGALNDIAARPDVRFCWLTTWLDEARYGLAPRIGLHGETWPVLGKEDLAAEDRDGWTGGWWKLHAAQAHAAAHPHDRIVWCDDELRRKTSATTWLASLGTRALPIIPKYDIGLTPEHLAQITAFVERPTRPTA